ncbi:PrsW family intramembrane metalloprotease [Patescibacteria group bacterium]|nr:PrsW family intramembrane metalloprotease [Patescibacteria group bacterium]
MNFLVLLLAKAFVPLFARISITVSHFVIYIFFGTTASAVWLLQFLRKDKLAEPVKMILKIFFWGMVITVPVFVMEFGAAHAIEAVNFSPFLSSILYWFLAIALVEEVFKYLLVKGKVLKNHAFDEPVDAMIYMIVGALGFAALENILYLLPPAEKIFSLNELFARTVIISFFRFVGATFLHALCSGLVGYFLALSLRKAKGGSKLTILGLLIVVLLHGLYNFSIMEIGGSLKFIIPIIILAGLFLFVTLAFKKLKKMKSICLLPKK